MYVHAYPLFHVVVHCVLTVGYLNRNRHWATKILYAAVMVCERFGVFYRGSHAPDTDCLFTDRSLCLSYLLDKPSCKKIAEVKRAFFFPACNSPDVVTPLRAAHFQPP